MRRRTTKADDARFMLARLSDATRRWSVGDRCWAYREHVVTTVDAIEGEIVTLANGDMLHVSKMRSASE